ncbi:GT2 family glycosyltransferase [Nonomuraea muscovyensis]|uniref:GT2 family glycosyltransferase n=1 Tax=Nonomuraea muscovyensis TaxID=1124761 RepID=A0A7X0F0B4_9ACTN|nr:glycosyltransferase [Nonomuraea muscovyensis]MBB6351122.1 GT2 family glycosyltransferase [Nonomuraea muscovyensis]
MNARPAMTQNDFSPLQPPELGTWSPALSVSVVVPAHGGPHLELTLAALAAQTYPDHLMEVLVVDDGSEPPIRLPEIRPVNTRLVRVETGWGISNAVNTGARAADGEIIQRLDSDMVACREHIEALARWHHLTDYLVTIGMKKFVEVPPLTAAEVYRARDLGEVFALDKAVASSTEATIAKTDGLRRSRNPYHVCTGPTFALPRDVFHAVGGLDPTVVRGEDTEFAYRLAMHGVVFIPDLEAQAVHLGLPAQHRDRERAVRAVEPYLAHRIPLRRDLRKDAGRRWLVPYVEIVLDVGDTSETVVRRAVAAALDGALQDVVVTLVGPWARLHDGRRSVLSDPRFELRLMRDLFAHDERIRLIDEAAPTPAPAPFRYRGPVDVPLHRSTLERMVETVQKDLTGVLVVDLPDGRTARLERTSALGRALLLAAPGDDLDDVIAVTHGVRHVPPDRYWPAPPAKPAPAAPAPAAPASARPGAGGGSGGGAAEPGEPAVKQPAQPVGAVVPASRTPAERTLLGRLKSALRPD